MKTDINPMHKAQRCHARCKRTGVRCKAPAVSGWHVCRMHGAGGGAPSGERNGNYKHGRRTREAMSRRAALRMLLKESHHLLKALKGA
jgi:hypothetical protein